MVTCKNPDARDNGDNGGLGRPRGKSIWERWSQVIVVKCPSCMRTHKADASMLGRRVKCKDCGAIFEVTSNEPPPVQGPSAEELEQIAAAASAAVAGPTAGDVPEQP